MTRRFNFLLVTFLLVTGLAAWASPKDDDYTRLARISYIEGQASYQHVADVDWSTATVNLPLEPGDRIYTGYDGKVEIEFEDGSVFRLARNTDVEVLSLKDELIQIRILVGLTSLVVSSDTDFEVNTPAAAFTALRKGTYRFSVEENGDSDAVVRKGELEAANNSFSRRVKAGELVHVAFREPENPDFARYDRRDDWDEWNDRRNADKSAYAGGRYLPDNVYMGVYDLHRHGRWVNIDTYGSAWVPYSVGISWSPYSVGRWCYRPLFGWTWISYEPWGWLPYHYGRWYRHSIHGWCWLPGPSFAFNFWSPALVTFYSGPSWISWCPLGPGDYYNINYYHYNRGIYGRHLAELQRLHWRDARNPFHRGDRDAFRTVDVDQFRNGSFGDRNRETRWRNVDQPWRRGEPVRERLNIQPTAVSFKASPNGYAVQPARINRRTSVVVRNSPGANLRGQEQYTRITNPDIPAIPSRAERNRTEERMQDPDSRSGNRVIQTPQRERTNPGVRSSSGNAGAEQGGRRVATPRGGAPDTNQGNARSVENNRPAARPADDESTVRRTSSGGRNERQTPEERKAQPSSSEMRPRIEEYRRPNSTEPRSGAGEGASDREPVRAPTPREERTRTYSAPRIERTPEYSAPSEERVRIYRTPREESAPSYSAPRVERAPSYSTPRQERAPSYSAPRQERAPSYSAPRQSIPSMERGSGPRVYSAPSPGRSSGNSGSSSASRSGGFSSPGRSSGGEGKAHSRK